MSITIDGVDVSIDSVPILGDVALDVGPGSVHGLVGPNGSGKSTLLRCVYRALRPARGAVRLDGDDVWRDLGARTAARRRAIVTQDQPSDLDFTVRDLVTMGRAPYKRVFERDNDVDRSIVDEALDAVRMRSAENRLVSTLSGGERQRILLARALAQQTRILVLDEPTNHLDVRAQLDLLQLVSGLGLTTLVALHDLDHAAAICDAVTVLDRGRVVATGAPESVLTVELIRTVFGVDAHIGTHPLTGRPHIALAPLAGPGTDDPRPLN